MSGLFLVFKCVSLSAWLRRRSTRPAKHQGKGLLLIIIITGRDYYLFSLSQRFFVTLWQKVCRHGLMSLLAITIANVDSVNLMLVLDSRSCLAFLCLGQCSNICCTVSGMMSSQSHAGLSLHLKRSKATVTSQHLSKFCIKSYFAFHAVSLRSVREEQFCDTFCSALFEALCKTNDKFTTCSTF